MRWQRPIRGWFVILLAILCVIPSACKRDKKKRRTVERAPESECVSEADCNDANPCTEQRCVDGTCEVSFAPAGHECDNQNVCDGVATCDGEGHCLRGKPPVVDDGNPCTTDECDPKRGAIHTPVPVDDWDECTVDACDPKTGSITHESVDIDDGDDCTLDSCDPKTGVLHQRPESFYTCAADCGGGFHAVSRRESTQCAAGGLRSYCVPDCGDSFRSCGRSCPRGYHSSSRTPNAECGPTSPLSTFCQKNAGPTFHTCDRSCPPGYTQQSASPSRDCGPDSNVKIFCIET